MTASDDYTVHHGTPEVEEYRALRAAAGLTPRSREAAIAGLPNTVAGVVARSADGRAVAMARAIGDGLNYEIVDVAVEPAHQGRGLGKRVTIGRRVEVVHVSDDELRDGFIVAGLPLPLADALVAMDVATRRGLQGSVTDAVSSLTGRPAQSLADFLADDRNRAALAGQTLASTHE